MPDDQNKGPALGDLGGSGEPSPTQPPQGSPTPPDAGDWRAQLIPEDIREDKFWANVKTPQDAMRMLVNSQKLIGKDKVVVPTADSPQEVWDTFLKVAGRPDKPEEYDFAADFGDDRKKMFDEAGLNEFKDLLHKSGAPKKVFEEATKWYADYLTKLDSAQSEQTKAQIDAGVAALRKEWAGEDYQINTGIAQAAIEQIGDEQLKELILGDDVLRNHPSIIKLFHRIGQSMQDHRPLATDSGASLRVDGVTHAKQKLKAFDAEHADVLFASNYQGPKNREEILAQRFQLMQVAWPERSTATGQGYSEVEIPIRIS